MYYKIINYNAVLDVHVLKGYGESKTYHVDLRVCGDLPELNGETPEEIIENCESIIGRTVVIERLSPNSFIADDAKMLPISVLDYGLPTRF